MWYLPGGGAALYLQANSASAQPHASNLGGVRAGARPSLPVLTGATVTPTPDPLGPRDQCGRTLAAVLADGRDVAEPLIAAALVRPLRGRSSEWCAGCRQWKGSGSAAWLELSPLSTRIGAGLFLPHLSSATSWEQKVNLSC